MDQEGSQELCFPGKLRMKVQEVKKAKGGGREHGVYKNRRQS
jgi:hypothetical protein